MTKPGNNYQPEIVFHTIVIVKLTMKVVTGNTNYYLKYDWSNSCD